MSEPVLKIKDGRNLYFLDPVDLLFIKADGNFCDIYKKLTVYKTVRIQIGQLWKAITELDIVHTLVRVDRSTIINIRYIEKVDVKKGSLILKRGDEGVFLRIAKSAGTPLQEKLNILYGDNIEKPSELKREDFPNDISYELHKTTERLLRSVSRTNDLYLLVKELNAEHPIKGNGKT